MSKKNWDYEDDHDWDDDVDYEARGYAAPMEFRAASSFLLAFYQIWGGARISR
jgi:hypothetical protein